MAAAWLAGGGDLSDGQTSPIPLQCAQVGLLSLGSTAGFLSRLGRRVAGSLGVAGSEASIRHRYLAAVVERHRYIHFPYGLSHQGPVRAEMQALFVKPRLSDVDAGPRSASLPKQGDSDRAEGSNVWSWLQDSWQQGQNLVVLGPPGSGKTTLLQYVALALTSHPTGSDASADRWLPAFVSLANLRREQVEAPGWLLPDAIVAHASLRDWTPPRDWIECQLTEGRFVVLLDGCDEHADPAVLRLAQEWVAKQVETYSSTPFVLTATPSGYRQGGLSTGRLCYLQAFDDEQRRLYLRKRQARQVPEDQNGHGGSDSEGAYREADGLARYVGQTPHLARIVERPLHLAMLMLAYEQGCDQPSNLDELYGQVSEILWEGQPTATPPAIGQPTSRPQLPVPLAFRATSEAQGVAAADYKEAMPPGAGLVVERSPGEYTFVHESIRHFLAATYLRTEAADSELFALPDTPPWREVLRFFCKEVEGRRVLGSCLSHHPPSLGVIRLAAMYLRETDAGDDAVRTQLEELLSESAAGDDPSVQQAAETALFDLRLGPDGDGSALGEPITIAEYEAFLEESPAAGVSHRPDHWSPGRRSDEPPDAPVAGLRAADAAAFCGWLAQTRRGPGTYRLPRQDDEVETSQGGDGTHAVGYWVVSDSLGAYMVKGAPPPPMTYSQEQLCDDLDLSLPDGLGFDLDRALARLLARAQARARAEARVLDLDLDRSIRRCRELARDLEENPALAVALGQTFARDFDSDLALTSYRAEGLSYHDPKLDSDRSTAHQLARVLSKRLAEPSEQQRVLAKVLGLTLSLEHILDVARDVDRAVRLVQRREPRLIEAAVRESGADAGWDEIFLFLWRYVASRSLLLTLQLTYARRALPAGNWSERMMQDKAAQQINERIHNLVSHYSDLFVEFVTLKRRMAGELPAFEGIRLARERAEVD